MQKFSLHTVTFIKKNFSYTVPQNDLLNVRLALISSSP